MRSAVTSQVSLRYVAVKVFSFSLQDPKSKSWRIPHVSNPSIQFISAGSFRQCQSVDSAIPVVENNLKRVFFHFSAMDFVFILASGRRANAVPSPAGELPLHKVDFRSRIVLMPL